MDWNSFWTAFGAIGATIGSIATSAAVIVALWQTKISFKKKLQVSFSDDIAVAFENGSNIYRFVGVNISNIGNRDVVIQNWGFYTHDNMQTIIAPDSSSIGRMIQVKLPHKLQIEEGITLYYDKKLFEQVLEEYMNDGKLNPNKKICFFVTDSTEKRYKVMTNKTVEDLLSKPKK